MKAGGGLDGSLRRLRDGPDGSPRSLGAPLLAAAIAVAVMFAAALELDRDAITYRTSPLATLAFVLCLGTAVGAARWAPELALAIAGVAGVAQVFGGVPVLISETALVVVLFAAARWGRTGTMVLAGASVAIVPTIAITWASIAGFGGFGGQLLIGIAAAAGGSRASNLLLLGLAVLGVPYLAGLALRFLARARADQAARQTAETQAQQATEIARLQEAQNRLARDVHDVVGHSLTVILAQAESAQFIDDPERLKRTMETIATSARTSLQDVRLVLTPGQEALAGRRRGLDALVEGVRASGHQVLADDTGDARPLPPELDTVAYRVLQEMLTNAIRHGSRETPVWLARQWPQPGTEMLVITVRNRIDGPLIPSAGGQGLLGMRRRLESVGGSLQTTSDDAIFTATATIPVRAVAG